MLGATLASLAIAVAACGGGDDDDEPTNTAVPAAPTASTAGELVPDMPALGFKPSSQLLPGLAETTTTKVALYESTSGPVKSVRFEIAIAASTEAATQQFNAFAGALKNPPPGMFGGDTKQLDGTPAFQADQSKSYKTDKPDQQGGVVFTDLHRFGRAVVIVYSIGPDSAETADVRKKVAEKMAAEAPQ